MPIKRIFWIVLAFTAIVWLGVGIYFLETGKIGKKEIQSETQITPSSEVIPSPTPDIYQNMHPLAKNLIDQPPQGLGVIESVEENTVIIKKEQGVKTYSVSPETLVFLILEDETGTILEPLEPQVISLTEVQSGNEVSIYLNEDGTIKVLFIFRKNNQ